MFVSLAILAALPSAHALVQKDDVVCFPGKKGEIHRCWLTRVSGPFASSGLELVECICLRCQCVCNHDSGQRDD